MLYLSSNCYTAVVVLICCLISFCRTAEELGLDSSMISVISCEYVLLFVFCYVSMEVCPQVGEIKLCAIP